MLRRVLPIARRLTAQPWWQVLKVLAIVAGLGLLLHYLLDERPLALWQPALLWGLALCELSMLAYALRFRAAMQVAGIALPRIAALRICLLAVFWHFFVPLSVGSELTRYARLRAHAPARRPGEIAAALVLDHALGVVALLGLAGILLLALRPFGEVSRWLPLAVWAGLASALVLLGVYRQRLPAPVAQALAQMAAHPGAVARALAWSVVMHLLLAGAVWTGSRGWQIALDYPHTALVQASAGLFQMLPVNLGGVGGGEVAGLGLYLALGLPRADALLLVSLLYCYRVVTALLGGAWELLSLRRGAQSSS